MDLKKKDIELACGEVRVYLFWGSYGDNERCYPPDKLSRLHEACDSVKENKIV